MQNDSGENELEQAAWLIGQRQVHPRRPSAIGRLIPRIIARSGVAGRQAGSEMETAWKQVAGQQWSACTIAGAVRRGKLEILVSDSMVLQELVFQQQDLLQQINQHLPQANISSLGFRVDPARFRH